jgi:death on curing protein
MATFLVLNNTKINASVDEQVEIILLVASGKLSCEGFAKWLANHVSR